MAINTTNMCLSFVYGVCVLKLWASITLNNNSPSEWRDFIIIRNEKRGLWFLAKLLIWMEYFVLVKNGDKSTKIKFFLLSYLTISHHPN